jgi:hypothetical protein
MLHDLVASGLWRIEGFSIIRNQMMFFARKGEEISPQEHHL